MPVARYFLYVGGALLALLFILDAHLPKLPVAGGGNSRRAIIHIHSDQKWPERIVYDTSVPTIIPAHSANIEANVAAPERVASATEREAFAQLRPSSQLSDAKKQPKLQPQRKIAKRRAAPPALLAARQEPFGWFGTRIW